MSESYALNGQIDQKFGVEKETMTERKRERALAVTYPDV